MGSRHRERSRSPRSRSRHRERDRDRDRDRSRERRKSKRNRSRERKSRERDHKSRSRRDRSRSKERKSKDRDGTIALLDQMVGTTTTSSSRQHNGGGSTSANHAAQAALIAAAAVAQRRISAPVQPAAAAAAALSAATAVPLSSSVQQRLNLLRGDPSIYYENDNSNPYSDDESSGDMERKKKRRSRWTGSEHDKTFIPGLPTVLPSTLTKDQEEQYLLQLQIEEVSRKLRSGDLGIPANVDERSPSPEPIYSSDGKRLNTREYRTRRKLDEQRHSLVQRMLQLNPEFKPPADYKPPVIRVHDKVMIPQEEHPDINFVGLLIGPRGNTLKSMEKETGAKIIIRGKGSVKEGKVGRKDGQPLPGEDEPLHAYITATNAECVKKAVEKIKEVIRQGVEVPEGQNDLRRMQLRELAQLNGTLRENDGQRCANCGGTDHKSWLCPDKPNVTNNIVCTVCGGAGHIARDCRSATGAVRRGVMGGVTATGTPSVGADIDKEYLSLMAELGEAPPSGAMQQGGNPNFGIRRPFYAIGNTGAQRAIMPAPGGMPVPGIPPSLPPPPMPGMPPVPPGVQGPPGTMPPMHGMPPPPIMHWMSQQQPPPPGGGPPGGPPNSMMGPGGPMMIGPPGIPPPPLGSMLNRQNEPLRPPGTAPLPPRTSAMPPQVPAQPAIPGVTNSGPPPHSPTSSGIRTQCPPPPGIMPLPQRPPQGPPPPPGMMPPGWPGWSGPPPSGNVSSMLSAPPPPPPPRI